MKIKKKIKDLELSDMPECWAELFEMNEFLAVLFTDNPERFARAKASIPDDIANTEIEYEVEV